MKLVPTFDPAFPDIPRFTVAQCEGAVGHPEESAPKRNETPMNPDASGGRNNYFTRRAGQMRRNGQAADDILAALRSENQREGYNLPDRELVEIARSVGSYEVSVDGKLDFNAIEANVKVGMVQHGLRVDAAGRFRDVKTLGPAAMTQGMLATLIWRDLRRLRPVAAEDRRSVPGEAGDARGCRGAPEVRPGYRGGGAPAGGDLYGGLRAVYLVR
jgi:hypothetical protein